MKFEVDHKRDGRTQVYWAQKYIVMRKPRAMPDDPAKLAGLRWAHYKRDGIRVVCYRDAVFTTQGHDIAEQLPEYTRLKLQDHTVVDAELYVPGEGREAVKSALAHKPEKLRVSVFACTAVESLWELQSWCQDHCLAHEAILPIADQRMLNTRTHDGFVLKDDRMYGQWFKEKPRLTMDLVVTGARPGKGQHSGRIGALELADRNGRFVCAAGAMDLPMRIALTEMWTNGTLVGRVVEVAYERVGSRGGLQHPRFIALRDDKEIKDADCIA